MSVSCNVLYVHSSATGDIFSPKSIAICDHRDNGKGREATGFITGLCLLITELSFMFQLYPEEWMCTILALI